MRPYDERLDHLLSQAARVFADKGYHSTTMRDLARATGMSLAGMYYYVKGKEELLYLIQDRCFGQVLEGAQAAVRAARTPLERLQAFVVHHVNFFARNLAAMKVLSHEANSLSSDWQPRVNATKRRYVNLLEGLLADVYPDQPAPERSAAAYALFGMMNWLYNWYDPAGALAPEQLAELMARLFLSGFTEGVTTWPR